MIRVPKWIIPLLWVVASLIALFLLGWALGRIIPLEVAGAKLLFVSVLVGIALLLAGSCFWLGWDIREWMVRGFPMLLTQAGRFEVLFDYETTEEKNHLYYFLVSTKKEARLLYYPYERVIRKGAASGRGQIVVETLGDLITVTYYDPSLAPAGEQAPEDT